jgi:hypothetical protein
MRAPGCQGDGPLGQELGSPPRHEDTLIDEHPATRELGPAEYVLEWNPRDASCDHQLDRAGVAVGLALGVEQQPSLVFGEHASGGAQGENDVGGIHVSIMRREHDPVSQRSARQWNVAIPDESNPPVSPTPEPSASGVVTHDVVVRRSPRYVRFILVGVVVAILLTLALTFLFPEQPDYSRAQVFGFVGIILVTLFVGLSATIAIIADRLSSRRTRTVVMTTSERVEIADEAETRETGTDEAAGSDEEEPGEAKAR